MTTRKQPRRALLAAAGAAALAIGCGCATPGPLHVYAIEHAPARQVRDVGPERATEVPSFVRDGERVTGFAYDPFTDHFFLRLAPGNRIRVVDRPARAIKRELQLASVPAGSDGDLAVRPRDGHLFLLAGGEVIETTRLGAPVRKLVLEGAARPIGLAFDSARDHLLALAGDGRRVTVHERDGRRVGEIPLVAPAGPGLAYDAARRELYAPLRDHAGELGVFDEAGALLRRMAAPGPLVDVGPRSFVRVF